MSILMSAENPTGAKLEEHLAELVTEIEAKCRKIEGDDRSEARTVLFNNQQIIGYLKHAIRHQEHSQKTLARLAPDQGPTGKPRIGVGSGATPSPPYPAIGGRTPPAPCR